MNRPGHCTLLISAAPLARRAVDITSALIAAGWRVRCITTLNAVSWVDADKMEALTETSIRASYGTGDSERAKWRDDVVVVCPATFNTMSKAALGIADTYAHSVLCESISAGIPVWMVPMVNRKLWGHPARSGHVDTLIRAGVRFVDPGDGQEHADPVESGTGDALSEAFDPAWLVRAVGASVSP